MVPWETVGFVFPRVLSDVSRNEIEGKIRTVGKTKLPRFPRDQTLGALLYIWTFPSTIAAKHPERQTTAELYPGRETFEFNQGT